MVPITPSLLHEFVMHLNSNRVLHIDDSIKAALWVSIRYKQIGDIGLNSHSSYLLLRFI